MEALQFVWLVFPVFAVVAISAKAPMILAALLLVATPLVAIATQIVIHILRNKGN